MRLIKNFVLTFLVGTILAVLAILALPSTVSANHGVCPPSRWGINSGNPNNPAGLVLKTVDVSNNPINGITWRINNTNSTSIAQSDAFGNIFSHVSSRTFTTGETIWCGSSTDNYSGVTVLGFGSTLSYGNHWVLFCQKWDLSGPATFSIDNVASPAGRNGWWTGNPGNFNVTNGSTTWITLTWHDTPLTGTIQGYKVPNAAPAAGQTVRLDGGSATTANPYFFTSVLAGNHTVSVSVPAGYEVGYTLCINSTGCHSNAPVSGSSVVVNVPAGGYDDLWWHYTPLPDLVIRNSSGGTSPAIDGPTSVVVGESATYQARTRNAGPGAAATSTTRAWTSGSSNNADDFSVGSLASGTNSAIHTFTTSWTAPGNYTVSFKADNAGVVTESSDGNNTASLTVNVKGADLVMRNAEGGTDPAITGPTKVWAGVNATFTAVTKNVGVLSAAASTTRAWTSGSSNDSDEFSVVTLAPGTIYKIHSFTTSWNTPGNHTVTFKADNTGVVAENSESNNTASITVVISVLEPEECNISANPTNITSDDRKTTITATGLDPGKQYRFVLSNAEGVVYSSEIKTPDANGTVSYVQSFQYINGSGNVTALPLGDYKIVYFPLDDPDNRCVANVTLFSVTYVDRPPPASIPTPFGPVCGTAVCLAEAFLNTGLGVVGGVAFLLMVLGAYRLIFAGGNPESVKGGREIITAAIAGLVVVIFAIFILNLLGIGILGISIV